MNVLVIWMSIINKDIRLKDKVISYSQICWLTFKMLLRIMWSMHAYKIKRFLFVEQI